TAPITTPPPDKVIGTTNKCPFLVLSHLYLNCHLLLLVFGYGKLEVSDSSMISNVNVRGMVVRAIEYLSRCFPKMMETDQIREKNVEIFLEMLWVNSGPPPPKKKNKIFRIGGVCWEVWALQTPRISFENSIFLTKIFVGKEIFRNTRSP